MLESEHGLVDLSQLADKFRRFEEKVYTYCKVIPNPNKRDEIEDLALSILNGVVNRIKDRNITDFNESNFVFEFEDRIMKKMLGIRFLHPDKPARRVKPTQTVPLRTRLLETQHIDALIDILRQMKVLTTEKRCAQFKRYLLGETLKEKIVFSTSIKALCTLFYNLKYARIIKMNKTELTLSIVSALIHHKKGELVFDSVYEYFKPKPSSGSERLTGAHKKYIDFDDHIAKLKPPI